MNSIQRYSGYCAVFLWFAGCSVECRV